MKRILLALTLTASTAFAQQAAPAASQSAAPKVDVDSRFSAWLGCWRLDDDLSGTGARMCVTPEKNGVRLQTIAGSNKGIDELVIPDGAPHAIVDSDCKGTEQAEFSKDGARLFRTTQVTCGKEAARTIKSVIFMAAGPAWINVQHVSGDSANTSVRVQRYRRSSNQNLADGSKTQQPDAQRRQDLNESFVWSIDDVIEANAKLPAEALQAALTEVNHKFDLNRKSLVALQDGGVRGEVIDLMVALTYPQRFVVQRAGSPTTPSGVLTGGGWFDPFMMSPLMSAAMFDCYTPFGYGYRSYYSMCGSALYRYGLYDAYYGYYGARPYGYGYYGWVDVGAFPAPTGQISTTEPQGVGRVVNGRGYTQIHDRQSEPSPRVSQGSNGGGWSGMGGGGGVSSSGGYSSGSASSGSSGGGGSSSSGGDSGARVAVPKGGGGN